MDRDIRFRRIVEKSLDAILVVDLSGYIQFANPAAMEILQLSRDTVYQHCFGLPALKGEVCEMDIRQARGNSIIVEVRASDIQWEGAPGYLMVLRDITHRKHLETELLQKRKMEAIGNLAGGIAHDFNNILTAIMGYTELALQDLDNPEQLREDLEESLRAGERAKALIQQILTFSRKTELELQPVDPAALIHEVLKMMRSTIPEQIRIAVHINSTQMVLANTTVLHQVLLNLLTNGIQAMGTAKGELSIEVLDLESPPGAIPGFSSPPPKMMEIRISDTGQGIPDWALEQIFDPYFTTKKNEGTGMGLAVVQGIIKDLGGSIGVETKDGNGSTFILRLPVALRQSDIIQQVLPPARQHKTKKVLVVDDEPTITAIVSRVLEKQGHGVTTENNPVQALERFKQEPDQFHLVITDLNMPVMSGHQLIKEIRRINPTQPILVCTGYLDDHKETPIPHDCEIIPKPIDYHILEKMVNGTPPTLAVPPKEHPQIPKN